MRKKIKRTTTVKIALTAISVGLNLALIDHVFKQSKKITGLEKENQLIREFNKSLKKNNDNLNYHLGKTASKLENNK